MSENIYFAAFFFPSAAAVLIFSMKYVSEILQARARLSQDKAYREIATQVASAQLEMVNALTDIQVRLAAIEKIFKEVG